MSELVGASIAVALWTNGEGIVGALGVINSGPVLGIYTAIFLSVVTAFVSAAVVMFLVRVVYGHDLKASFPRWGWLWTGVSFAAMTYFVLFKGLQGAAILDEDTMSAILDGIFWILGGVFVVASGLAIHLAAPPRAGHRGDRPHRHGRALHRLRGERPRQLHRAVGRGLPRRSSSRGSIFPVR